MLLFLSNLAEVLLPVSYALTLVAYGQAFYREDATADRWSSRLLRGTAVLHTLYIGVQTRIHGHCMVTTPFEVMSLIAFTVVASYAVIEHRTGVRGAGFFVLSLAAFFEFLSAVITRLPSNAAPNPVLSQLGIGLHVSFAIFGLGSLGLSAVFSVLYQIMYRELKRPQPGAAYRNLPSLEALERLSVSGMGMGMLLFTASMLIGVIWLPRVFEQFSYLDPKLLVTGVVWLLYAVVFGMHLAGRIDGRRFMQLSVWGFIFSLLSLTVVNMFLSSFHRFL
jgi:ABC-type uncharacterized transport system permease subunit